MELAEMAGLYLDPWQQFTLDCWLGERPDGKWAATECGLVVPRQNGKGGILEARELVGLYLLPEKLITHTAHLFDTALEAFRRVLELIEQTPDLDRKVKRVSKSHGDEGIELLDGSRLRFKTRTRGGGRGISGDTVILDEAFELPAVVMTALTPTLSAKPNPQLIYTSTPPDQDAHPNGVTLAKLRESALADAERVCYLEWSVDETVFNEDPEAVADEPRYWAMSNPAYGIRLDAEFIQTERRALTLKGFAVERLGIGDWPSATEGGEQVIDAETWSLLQDPSSRPTSPVALAVDVTPDRKWTAIGAATPSTVDGEVVDGVSHIEVADHRAGTRWLVDALVRMVEVQKPCVVMIDGRGPAASLLAELEKVGIGVADGTPTEDAPIVLVSAGEMAAACGAFYDAATAMPREIVHAGQKHLDQALKIADQRPLSEAWAWSRRKSEGDISPLVAVTLALYGLSLYGEADRWQEPMVAFR